MEKKLKKQRRKLIFRVTVILFLVWLIVASVYTVIRLNNEKTNIKSKTNAELQIAIRNINAISGTGVPANHLTYYLIESTKNSFENDEIKRDLNSEFALCEYPNGKTITTTSHKLDVAFGLKTGLENSDINYGFINRDRFMSTITKSQLNEISEYLNSTRNDEKYYELVCTKFYMDISGEIIPKEIQIVLTEEENVWYAQDEPVKTYILNSNNAFKAATNGSLAVTKELLICSDMKRNVISKVFLFGTSYNYDLSSTLCKDELAESAGEKRVGFADYIFYTADLLNYNPKRSDAESAINNVKPYILRYAKRVNVLESCWNDLITGISAAFLFFFIIAVLMIVLTWRIIKNQFNEEQKRLELTNALAHDIKTPLFVISGYAQSLKENINNEKKEHFADRIVFKTEEANETIHKMLNLSKLESYNLKLNLVEFDFSKLINEILADYVHLPEGKKISFSYSGDKILSADKALIRVTLENLIDNAIKHSTPNSVIEIKIERKRFIVSNTCDDLTKSDIKDIMSPYVRKDKSRHQKGSGLGLAIVKAILDLHRIKYRYNIKAGRFTFNLYF